MKKLAKQVGKALLYFMLYFGWQILWSFLLMFAYVFAVSCAETFRTGNAMDSAVLQQKMLDQINDLTSWVTIYTLVMVVVCLWGVYKTMKKSVTDELLLHSVGVKWWPGVVLSAVGVYMTVAFGLEYLPFSEEVWESYAEASEALSTVNFMMVVATVIGAPIVEELTFRCLIFGRLMKAMPVWLAAVLSSLVFAVMHGQILWMTYTFLLGMVCCIAMYKTNSVLPGIFIHMFFNLFGGALNDLMAKISTDFYLVLTGIGILALIAGVVLLLVGKTEATDEDETNQYLHADADC